MFNVLVNVLARSCLEFLGVGIKNDHKGGIGQSSMVLYNFGVSVHVAVA